MLMKALLERLEKYILIATVFLFPLTVLPISPNPFVVPKLAVLVFGVSLLLIAFCIRVIISGKLEFSIGSFDFPTFLIGIAYLTSLIWRTPNKMEGLLLPGTATAIIFGVLLYFLINQAGNATKKDIPKVLFISATFFSIITLLSFLGIFEKIPQLPDFIRSTNFNPEGGYLPAAIFLGVVIPIGVGILMDVRQITRKSFWGVCLGVIILALAVSIFNILPGKPLSPRFPGFATSWNILVDALKESPLFGVGPGNYLTAFNRFRPLFYNQTDLWAIKFTTASDFYLTALTEVGMLGAAGLILLVLSLYRYLRQLIREEKTFLDSTKTAQILSLLILIIMFAIVPVTILLVVILFILLALNSKVHITTLSLTTQGTIETGKVLSSRFPAFLLTIPIIIAVILADYNAGKILIAEYKFKKAIDALSQNQARQTYDTIREAIRKNPWVDRYHAIFAQVNLALANAIIQKATNTQRNSQDKGQQSQLSDQDRQDITTLISQAIAEGKAAVALNPLRSGNWEILGQVYRAIMPLAQGADNFAIQTYSQAVNLDPLNPNLRIALGGIYYAKQDYETAVRVFELAALAKRDLANAHYNLAFALRDRNQKGDLDKAISEMTIVLSLIDKNSEDFEIAQKALEDMQAKKKAEVPQGTELTVPQKAEEKLKPPLELPTGSEPPETSLISPTPSLEATPTLTPTPSP